MSHNNMITGVVVVPVLIVLVALGVGFAAGATTVKLTEGRQTAMADTKVTYEIKPYTGVGSGVLESGTLLDLTGKDQYTEPADIVGHIDAAGTWAMVRSAQ